MKKVQLNVSRARFNRAVQTGVQGLHSRTTTAIGGVGQDEIVEENQ